MEGIAVFVVVELDVGKRIDSFVSENTDLSRSAAARLAENGDITVNGKQVAKNYKLRINDSVEVELPEPECDIAEPEDIPVDIIYEDEDIAVVNKPSGMVVHPAAGNRSGTLVNALLYRCRDSLSGVGGVARPGIVHRIDKDTSGLLVVAKNDRAHNFLSALLKTHDISRVYYAIVIGKLREQKGTVDAPIGRHPSDRKKMAVLSVGQGHSRNAVTHYEVIKEYSGFSFVKCKLETGRTHQIRVHMAYLGHPILGDPVYGGDKTKFEAQSRDLIHGQCLHAGELTLKHPKTGLIMTFKCDMPQNMQRAIEKLEKISQ